MHWIDAWVRRDEVGRPHLHVAGHRRGAGRGARAWTTLHLSLSHDAGIASAVVIAEGDGPAWAPA